MSAIFYEIENDEKFQDLIFNENPEGNLEWGDTYYSLLRDRFGKDFPIDFPGFLVTPNSDNNRKRKKADAYLLSACSVMVLSERLITSGHDFFDGNGQFLRLIDFPFKGYLAYHVTNVISDGVVWGKSNFRQAEYGKILYKATLDESRVAGNEIFMIKEKVSSIYVSENFRRHFEENFFVGLDFSSPICTE